MLCAKTKLFSSDDGESGIDYEEEPPPTPTSPTSQGSVRSSTMPRTSSGTLQGQGQSKKKAFFKKVQLILYIIFCMFMYIYHC